MPDAQRAANTSFTRTKPTYVVENDRSAYKDSSRKDHHTEVRSEGRIHYRAESQNQQMIYD
ncbi:MAG: hypothetical protein ACK521_02160 [bacterium]